MSPFSMPLNMKLKTVVKLAPPHCEMQRAHRFDGINSVCVCVCGTGSGFLVVSVWDVTTLSTVGSVPTANTGCRAPKPGDASAANADAYVPFAR